MTESWEIYDTRTDRRATIATFRSEASAWRKIAAWWRRHCEGGRPDIDFGAMVALSVRKVREDVIVGLIPGDNR